MGDTKNKSRHLLLPPNFPEYYLMKYLLNPFINFFESIWPPCQPATNNKSFNPQLLG